MKNKTSYKEKDLMTHFIDTDKISNPFEKQRKQQEILSEMNNVHKGKGVVTVDEHGDYNNRRER